MNVAQARNSQKCDFNQMILYANYSIEFQKFSCSRQSYCILVEQCISAREGFSSFWGYNWCLQSSLLFRDYSSFQFMKPGGKNAAAIPVCNKSMLNSNLVMCLHFFLYFQSYHSRHTPFSKNFISLILQIGTSFIFVAVGGKKKI